MLDISWRKTRSKLGLLKFETRILLTKMWLHYLGFVGRRRVGDGLGVTVSLTTYGDRMRHCHLTIESIVCGSEVPGRLILWIAKDDYREPLPRPLRRLKNRGLEIRTSEDLGPHKKYYPALALSSISGPLVTADDDVIYPRYWLKKLVARHHESPCDIFCFRARVMQFTSPGQLKHYADWPFACNENQTEGPLFITGVSGVIYPPVMLEALRKKGNGFLESCLYADDIWLSHTAHINNIKIRIVDNRSRNFLPLERAQVSGLKHSNLGDNGNDRQLRSTYSEEELLELQKSEVSRLNRAE